MTAEGRIFKITAVRAGIHGSAKGRITAVDYFVNVIHFESRGWRVYLIHGGSNSPRLAA